MARKLGKPIVIHLEGELWCGIQASGYEHDDVTIGTQPLDHAIANALDLIQSGRTGAMIGAGVGICELTLVIRPDEEFLERRKRPKYWNPRKHKRKGAISSDGENLTGKKAERKTDA